MTGANDPLIEIFREEAVERLDQIVACLLEIEAGRGRENVTDELFRHAHSIKGSAGMVGCDEARTIAGSIEEVLAPARERGGLTPSQVGSLLQAADALRHAVAGRPDPSANAPAMSATLRVPTTKIDRMLDAVGETVLQHRRLEHTVAMTNGANELADEVDRSERLLAKLEDAVLDMRTLPLSSITGAFPRAVRDVAIAAGKEVDLFVTGDDTQLDRALLEGMSESITHLLRNAVAHGIEAPHERERVGKPRRGRIELHAEPRGADVAIEVRDNGGGIRSAALDQVQDGVSLLDVLARAGFTTSERIDDLAGRGVGMDAVKTRVESVGGSVEVTTEPGAGTCVTLKLPVTLALLRVLIVERGGQRYGLPLTSISEAVAIDRRLTLAGRLKLAVRDERLWVLDLARVLGADAPELGSSPAALIVRAGGTQVGLACDQIVGEDEVLVRPLGFMFEGVRGYLGATIVQDGSVLLIVDPAFVVQGAESTHTAARTSGGEGRGAAQAPKVLVVDDQFTVRELQRSILGASGYRVETASDANEALQAISRSDDLGLVVTDLQMPGMDGLELVRSIRSEPRSTHLPVIIVSSRGTSEDRQRGADAGADAYIVKDEFDQRALLATVQELIGRR